MYKRWTPAGTIARGGAVTSIVADVDNTIWLATGAGIFRHGSNGWQTPPGGQPLAQPQTLLTAGHAIFAAGVEGKLVYTPDHGVSWYEGRVPQATPHVSCFARSPNYHQDRVLLAGTFDTGILRTTDGGKNWHLANTGLQTFEIHDLATAPVWEQREILLAATEAGIYRSYNGGRAWKFAALEHHAVSCLAISPHFSENGIALAGTQTAGLWRTQNGGKTWQPLGKDFCGESITHLQIHPSYPELPKLLVVLADGRLLRSKDDGQSWEGQWLDDIILTLQEVNGRLYAGFHRDGLATSDDFGDSWQHDQELHAHAIVRLFAMYGHRLLAQSITGQMWSQGEQERTWHELDLPYEHGTIQYLALAPGSSYWLAATANELLRTTGEGHNWRVVQLMSDASAISFSSLSPQDHRVWAGTAHGRLYMSEDRGLSWSQISAPESWSSVIALAEDTDRTLTAVIYDHQRQELSLWNSLNQGATWSQALIQSGQRPVAHLLTDGAHGPALAALGSTCWLNNDGEWQEVFRAKSQILRLLRLPNHHGSLIALHQALYLSSNDKEWHRLPANPDAEDILDVVAFAKDEGICLIVLGRGGKLWEVVLDPR